MRVYSLAGAVCRARVPGNCSRPAASDHTLWDVEAVDAVSKAMLIQVLVVG